MSKFDAEMLHWWSEYAYHGDGRGNFWPFNGGMWDSLTRTLSRSLHKHTHTHTHTHAQTLARSHSHTHTHTFAAHGR